MIDEYYGSEATSLDDVLSQLGDSAELTLREGNEEEFNAQAAAQEANAAPIIRFRRPHSRQSHCGPRE